MSGEHDGLSAAVSKSLVNALIRGIRVHGITYLRAPCESDGQLFDGA